MNKKSLYIISLLTMMVAGCMNNVNSGNSNLNASFNSTSSLSTSIDNVQVKSFSIEGYNDTVEFLHDFDTSSVKVIVKYSDNSKETFFVNSLTFNYDSFDSKVLGKQKINVSIDKLGISKDIEVEVIPAKTLKVLMVGNSYSDDTIQWVNEICSSLDINVEIANLYIGGCTLETHYKNLLENNDAYAFRIYDNTNKTWTTRENTSIKYALNYYDWDFVTLQQASAFSGVEDTYIRLDSIIELISELKSDVKFIWNMTWAYQQDINHSYFGNYAGSQDIMYRSILQTVQNKIVDHEDIKTIIPNGTAIQNTRTSYVGDTLCRDIYCHLTYDFGRYIAGLTLVKTMTAVDISNITYAPNGVDDSLKNIAIEAVNNAIVKPFEITNSVYDKEPVMDLSNHVEINYDSVGCAYYNSNAAGYSTLTTNSNNSMDFVATETFTKEEIPVGSIIYIEKGYQYRPEGWVDDAPQTTTRPNNTSTKYVVVDEAWWGDYTVRAFNISSNDSLMNKMKEAKNALHIYVPKDAPLKQDSLTKVDDTELFSSKGLNISDYSNYEYVFQNGFYDSATASSQTIKYAGETATKFICTEVFTKETLPVGSIIVVDEGYQYRPDGWVNDELNTTKPGNVTTNFVVIDETWWGDYTVRGFNISTKPATAINQIPYEVISHFRIYVPNSVN